MFHFEKKKLRAGFTHILGVDEVGRGSLAGPVVATAVLIDTSAIDLLKGLTWTTEITDSKQLTPATRERLSQSLFDFGINYATSFVSPAQVDMLNIHRASLLAMHKAVQGVLKKLSNNSKIFLYIDGRFSLPNVEVDREAVIGGDAKVFTISTASIIAKVQRDSFMVELSHKFPNYAFAQHKGYGTKQHITALKKFGLCDVHRQTFCKKYV